MKKPKVSIAMINYNASKDLPSCIKSLQDLDYPNKEIYLIDQASTDDSVDLVIKKFPKVKVIHNKNTGYAGGANKAYEVTDGEYLMILNTDLILNHDYLSKAVNVLDHDPKIGAITGKFLKFNPDSHTPILDTTGLLAFKNRRVVDRGQGFEDVGQFDKEEQVFGISGCCALYRRSALEDIALKIHNRTIPAREVWDNDFFMYKEDIDVSWRLNLRGWKCYYIPQAIGYHKRGTAILKRYSNKDVLKHRKSVPKLARYYSYKNQRLMQLKNEIIRDVVKNLPVFFIKEILTIGYVALREPRTFLAFFHMLWQIPKALKKRRQIQHNRKIDSMAHFFTGNPEDAFKSWNR